MPVSSTLVRISWLLRIPLAVVFCFTAWNKFTAAPVPVATVEALGTGQWLRIVIAILELAGAIGLLVPALALPAAGGLLILMLGAVATHLFIIGGSPLAAVLLAVACGTVVVALTLQELEALRERQNRHTELN